MVRDGSFFESEAVHAIDCNLSPKQKKMLSDLIGTDEDKYHGTDFKFYGIRYDITLKAPEGKDNLHLFKEKFFLRGLCDYVWFGIRFGNAVAKFSEPVVVLGLDVKSCKEKGFNIDSICDVFCSSIMDIIEKAENLYYDFLDAQEGGA